MQSYVFAIILVGTGLWFAAFGLNRPAYKKPAKLDRRARWGMILEFVAYALLWQGHFWEMSPGPVRIILSILCFVSANALSWTATRALGRQWRVDAGLNADHELVQQGPYRIVRHPIYASMLCVFLGMGLLVTPPLLFAIAAIVFFTGTEIRVRIEDGLLASHFGDAFQNYRRSVRAYIPFLR